MTELSFWDAKDEDGVENQPLTAEQQAIIDEYIEKAEPYSKLGSPGFMMKDRWKGGDPGFFWYGPLDWPMIFGANWYGSGACGDNMGESNFATFKKLLEENIETQRTENDPPTFEHHYISGNGGTDLLMLNPRTRPELLRKAVDFILKTLERLDGYPVLDEEDFQEREQASADACNMSLECYQEGEWGADECPRNPKYEGYDPEFRCEGSGHKFTCPRCTAKFNGYDDYKLIDGVEYDEDCAEEIEQEKENAQEEI